MPTIRILIAAAVIVLAGACDSDGLITPEGPAEFRVDLQYHFDDDLVVIELDGVRVYRERIATLDVLSLADMVEFSIPEGEHVIRVSVNGDASSSTEFTAGEYPVLAVTFQREDNTIGLRLLSEPPLYD